MRSFDIEKRRKQNLSSPRQDARGVTPSVRSIALDDAEVGAIAVALDEPQQELVRLQEASRSVSVPVLRCDLLLEEFQIYESRVAGVDAVLLHASALAPDLLARMAQAAKSTHMAACIACTSPEELLNAAQLRPAVIALPPSLLHLQLPPRTLLLALADAPGLLGRADAVLDEEMGAARNPSAAFLASLAGGS